MKLKWKAVDRRRHVYNAKSLCNKYDYQVFKGSYSGRWIYRAYGPDGKLADFHMSDYVSVDGGVEECMKAAEDHAYNQLTFWEKVADYFGILYTGHIK